jgi:hypothetical protein
MMGIKRALHFAFQNLFDKFFTPKKYLETYVGIHVEKYLRRHVKYPIFLSDVNQARNVSTDCSKTR